MKKAVKKKVTVKPMKDKCKEYGISTEGMLKAEIMSKLFQRIIDDDEGAGDECAAGNDEGAAGNEQVAGDAGPGAGDEVASVDECAAGNEQDAGDAGPAQSKSEECCWMRGNWLSFVQNIAKQCDYMGRLPHLW
jgi:hypothetical protein